MVRLRVYMEIVKQDWQWSFNSTMVRLRVSVDSILEVKLSSFNSTMVRLRVRSLMKYHEIKELKQFQFHYGTIKGEALVWI